MKLFMHINLLCSSKKMKLSDHWKNFIQPIRWRCKWVELKLKQFESQALKYSEELAEYDKRKHGKPDHFTLEEKGSKSFPFLNDVYRSKARKRRKRKRVEETPDLASYTSHHVLFSYLGTTTNFYLLIYFNTSFSYITQLSTNCFSMLQRSV